MKLSGEQVAAMRAALLDGYRSEEALRAMVRIGLDENLETVAGGATLDAVVLSLIDWAERTNKVLPLADAALAYNPGNEALQALAAQAHAWPADPAPTTAPADEPDRRNRWLIGGLIAAGVLIALVVLAVQQFYPRAQLSAQQAITWNGRIVDAQSGQPVPRAKVMFEAQGFPLVVYSDSEGLFRITSEGEPPIIGRLYVEAAGFQPYDRFVTVDASSPLQEIRLSPV